MKSSFLVLIPARGGSKGVPKKNIVDIYGKPLIQYTIDIAIRLREENKVDKVIVSTDCREIATIASNLGAEVPFIRPEELATDKSKTIDTILYAIEFYESKNMFFNSLILLQPTSPMRSYEDLVNAINIYNQRDDQPADSLISVYKEEQLNDLIMYKKDGNLAIPLNNNHNEGIRRQDYEKLYIRNGAIYITNIEYLKNNRKVISDLPLLYEMPKERSINIDSKEDLEFFKWLLKK